MNMKKGESTRTIMGTKDQYEKKVKNEKSNSEELPIQSKQHQNQKSALSRPSSFSLLMNQCIFPPNSPHMLRRRTHQGGLDFDSVHVFLCRMVSWAMGQNYYFSPYFLISCIDPCNILHSNLSEFFFV